MTADIQPGDIIRIFAPDNPRLHGALADVVDLAEWGAHVTTSAAATGQFRAAREEMEFVARPWTGHVSGKPSVAADRTPGYEGEACPTCGAMRLRRNGACLLCDACGSTTGCS